MWLLLPCARGDATLTTLVPFTGTNGNSPFGQLIQGTDGDFYGTLGGGSSNGYGAIFKVTSNATLTTLYAFKNVGDGYGPYAGLIQGIDGDFYGTTLQGGATDQGTVFRMTPAGSLVFRLRLLNKQLYKRFCPYFRGLKWLNRKWAKHVPGQVLGDLA